MEEEHHLRPRTEFTSSTHEFTPDKPSLSHHQQASSSSKCFVYTLFLVVLLSIFALIFGLVVLRVHAPTLRFSNVVVRDLRYGPSSLNATLVAETRLHNSNFGRFRFRGGNATVLRGNAAVGSASIGNGFVGRRERRGFNLTVQVSDRDRVSSGNFSAGIESGLIELRGSAELRGEVRVVRIMRSYRTAVMNCTMGLNLTGQVIQDLSCQ